MSHSLLRASPHTHVKIVVLALLGAILIVLGGIAAHVNANHATVGLQGHAPVAKAAKPVSYTGQGGAVIR
jgi:hypothetical protein